MKRLALFLLVAVAACTSSPTPLAPTAPSRNSVVYPDAAPNLPADLSFTVTPADNNGVWIAAHWTDTNNGTALVDFGVQSPFYSPYQIITSSWYGTQTEVGWWMDAGQVYQVHVRMRSPYQEAFVMPTPDNIVDPSRVKYSAWSDAYLVDATGGTLAVASGKRRKK